MRSRLALVSALLVVAGCGDDGPARPADLSMPSEDLSLGGDLALRPGQTPPTQCGYAPGMFPSSRDTSQFCAGTAIAGTCVQTFFAKLAGCYVPAGCCVGVGNLRRSRAWASGAWAASKTDISFQFVAYQNGNFCAGTDNAGSQIQNWTAWDGSKLKIQENGDVLCDDGKTVHLGSTWGGCNELQNLLMFSGLGCEIYPFDGGSCCTPFPLEWQPQPLPGF